MKVVYELKVYRLAGKLSDMIWFEFDNWNEKAQLSNGFQIIRAPDSIAFNIAKGYRRYTPDNRKNSTCMQEFF